MLRRSPDAVLPVGGAARGRLVRCPRSGRHAARRGARRRRQGPGLPQRLPASRHAGRRAAPAARAPSSAAITAGPTISKAGCATSRTRTGFPGFDKRGASAGAGDGERAPGPGVRDPGRAGAGRRFARWARPADRARPAAVRHRRARLRGQLEDPRSKSFIEGYHIKSTHPESFLPYGFDNLNVIDLFGRHSRVTYPFQRIKKLAKVPAARAPGRRPADLCLSPVPQCADHRAVAPYQRGDPRAARRRSHAAVHLHADQRRRRRSRGAGRGQARRRVRRHDRRGGGPRRSRRRSSAAWAAAPTTPSPSASSRAPSCTSTRR